MKSGVVSINRRYPEKSFVLEFTSANDDVIAAEKANRFCELVNMRMPRSYGWIKAFDMSVNDNNIVSHQFEFAKFSSTADMIISHAEYIADIIGVEIEMDV